MSWYWILAIVLGSIITYVAIAGVVAGAIGVIWPKTRADHSNITMGVIWPISGVFAAFIVAFGGLCYGTMGLIIAVGYGLKFLFYRPFMFAAAGPPKVLTAVRAWYQNKRLPKAVVHKSK